MPKQIYFLRHAKSDWSIPGQKDFEPDLNTRGNNDAPKMGKWLFDKGLKPGLIVSSPALRAKQTAEYVAEQLKYDSELIEWNEEVYEASARTLLNVITQLDDRFEQVMIVGHNPGLTYIAEYLTKENLNNIPTTGFVHASFEAADRWAEISEGTGKVVDFLYPRNTFTVED